MANFRFDTIGVSDAMTFNGAADTLSIPGANAAQITVLYAAATADTAEHVTLVVGGQSVDFGTGLYGDTDTRLADGSMLFVGGAGAEQANGTALNDGLYGGQGGDSLDGGDGGDLLQGNQGGDRLDGGLGSDAIYGGQDNDTIHVGVQASPAGETNFANGNKGDDVVLGGAGADLLLGGQGADVVDGGAGDDFLDGTLGDDLVTGAAGADTVLGEGGADMLGGGPGDDRFVFAAGSSDAGAKLVDTIIDFEPGDRIHFDGASLSFGSVSAPPPVMGGYYGGYGGDYGVVANGYADMLARANAAMAGDPSLDIVAADTNEGLVVFADTNGDDQADLAVMIPGLTLAELSGATFV
jgi:Ca2+-binding RTX toxin-like protein